MLLPSTGHVTNQVFNMRLEIDASVTQNHRTEEGILIDAREGGGLDTMYNACRSGAASI